MSFFNTYCLGADYSLVRKKVVRKKVLPWKCGRANEQWSLGYVRREKLKNESRKEEVSGKMIC